MAFLGYDVLPDGTGFRFWDCETKFTKTWHVAQGDARARDDEAGTEAEPFRTIGRAAEVVQPGERVVIGAGIYRECVRIARGGTGKDKMVSFEGKAGEKVVISGAEVWKGPWVETEGWPMWGRGEHGAVKEKNGPAKIWMGRLPGKVFEGYNPFGMSNVPNTPWAGGFFFEGHQGYSSKREYLMRRGILFVDGVMLAQAEMPGERELQPGTFWIEDSGLVVHFRLADDGDPKDHVLEFTAREQCFTSVERYQGFVRVKGLTFEKVGNGCAPPQRGAISTNGGNHWIIEDCEVRWANTIGMDIGKQSPAQVTRVRQGRHIVRRNLITDCGVCGIAGVQLGYTPESDPDDLTKYDHQATGILVEKNRLERIGWRDVEGLCESAAIKVHMFHNSLIRNNVIVDTIHGSGIWTDWQNVNTRVCGNAILGIRFTMFGGIFMEASKHRNSVDNNVIWKIGTCPSVGGDKTCGGNGVYQHDSDFQVVRNNLIFGATKAGVMVHLGEVGRMVYGRGSSGRKNRVEGNLIAECAWAMTMPTADNVAEGNCYGHQVQEGILRIERPEERLSFAAWREFMGWDKAGRKADVRVVVDVEKLRLVLKVDGVEKVVEMGEGFVLEGMW